MDINKTTILDANQYRKFSSLISAYLNQKENVRDLYTAYPEAENLYNQAQSKLKQYQNRDIVYNALKKQLSELDLYPKQIEYLEKFKLSNTVTVTTGHQLNLMTGPMYFFYKILQTIRCCEELNQHYPNVNFVPIFWMATEDHDFEEINHFYSQNQLFTWSKTTSGPVGKLNLEDLEACLQEFIKVLPESNRKKEIQSLISETYLNSKNLTEATRKLVHQLLGERGILMLDGDDPELKKLMIPHFSDELLHQTSFQKVTETNQKLDSQDFNLQVHPREINLFYIGNGELRERIVRNKDKFEVLNTSIKFSEKEILEELEQHPEKFSPNALLRPFYQENILPNIAYIGGAGEIAYWLQLKSYFDQQQVLFPILIVRNSALLLTEKQFNKIQQLQIDSETLFQPLYQIVNKKIKAESPLNSALDTYEKQLKEMFDELANEAYKTDSSFLDMVEAQRTKQLKGLESLHKRMIRAEKIRQQAQVEKIENLYKEIFPLGNLQERFVNFTEFWMHSGSQFVDEIYREIHPWKFQFIIKTLP